MKNFDKWLSRYVSKFSSPKKIIRQFDGEKYVLRFKTKDGKNLISVSILENNEEWDEGIYECGRLLQFEDFKKEEELWRLMKSIDKI